MWTMSISDLPAINATFNLLATCCLVFGYYSIKKKNRNEKHHRLSMLSAVGFSAIFLVGYLVYHYHHGSTRFPELGWIKTVYLIILIPHIILAAVMVPMIFLTLYHALRGNDEKHRKIARLTFPIWMYVSVTGVIIFLMVYQWFKV
jgi:putative membrane protein